MGTESEEAAARNELERVRTENAVKAMQREQELAKLREEQAKAGGRNNMSAGVPDGTAAVGWPDSDAQAAPGRLTRLAGSLGVGAAGDAAFAKKLLDAERRPAAGSAEQQGSRADGARERIAGALNARGATPAAER